jgi:hypothetical protein
MSLQAKAQQTQQAQAAQPAQEATQGSSKFLAPLVPMLVSAITPALQAGFGCIFDRMFSFMGANPNPACAQPNQTAVLRPVAYAQPYGSVPGYAIPGAPNPLAGPAVSGVPMGTSALLNQEPASPAGAGWSGPPGQPAVNTWSGPPAQGSQLAPAAGSDAQMLAATPVFSFIVNKLSDGTPQASVTQTVQFANARKGANDLAFDIRTGESFSILFATTVPGRVRLINTDVAGQVSTSDYYEALPAADNRMPRDWQGGITMAGSKGTEYLDVDFTPCVSQQYATDPRVAMFQGLIPACSQEAATKRFIPARANGQGGPAESGAKAMVFPSSPSPGQPIGLAPANYAKGDGLTFRITINHQ